MTTYANEIRKLVAAGKSPIEAERTVRHTQPDLRNELLQQADANRGYRRDSRGRRSALPSAETSTATATPDVNDMLARAVAGEHFTEAVIYEAVSLIHKTTSWFRNEVQHLRQNLRDEEAERQERQAKRSTSAPSRKPAKTHTHEPSMSFVMPNVRQGFDSLVAEAAKCEREFSDSEVLAAGHDVARFRDRLASAVLNKVLHRKFEVGAIVCDCSGAGGVCVCR